MVVTIRGVLTTFYYENSPLGYKTNKTTTTERQMPKYKKQKNSIF